MLANLGGGTSIGMRTLGWRGGDAQLDQPHLGDDIGGRLEREHLQLLTCCA
jgi:hypothetical protein